MLQDKQVLCLDNPLSLSGLPVPTYPSPILRTKVNPLVVGQISWFKVERKTRSVLLSTRRSRCGLGAPSVLWVTVRSGRAGEGLGRGSSLHFSPALNPSRSGRKCLTPMVPNVKGVGNDYERVLQIAKKEEKRKAKEKRKDTPI